MRISFPIALALTLTAGPLTAQDALPKETVRTIRELEAAALASPNAYELVRSLTDEVGPRHAGSPGDAAGVAWAVATLKRLGFSNVRAEKVMVPHWVRGAAEVALVSPGPERSLAAAALGGSVGTPEGGLEAEVVEATSLEAVDALGEKAKGRIVLLWAVTERARDGAGYGKTAGLRVNGASRAAKVGAIGLLLRSVGTDASRLPHTGAMRYQDGVPRIPAAALSTVDADFLHRKLGKGETVRVRMALSCKSLPDAESANVVGEIPGREKPDEIVLLGAHLDSWDLGTGAVDDAAGCAHVIEAARLIGARATKPRRTLRVVLYANEEFGLRGGRQYVIEHANELQKHVAAFESDSGSGRVWGLQWNAGPGAEKLFRGLVASLAATPLEEKKGGDGGADISTLKASGVPLIGLRCDASRYFDVHHTAGDVLEEVKDPELRTGVAATAALAWALADAAEPLPRIPEAERVDRSAKR